MRAHDGQIFPGSPAPKSRRAYRAVTSLHEEVFFEIALDNVAFDDHTPFERAQVTFLSFCDRLHARDRLATQCHQERLAVLLHFRSEEHTSELQSLTNLVC